MRSRKLLCAVLVLVLLISLPAMAAGAEAPAQKRVRVGFFAFAGYHDLAPDGRRSGYGYEFLQRLATHCDLTYEYLGYDCSYAEALELLRKGEVDLVTSVSYTPERAQEFLFSRQDIGSNSTVLSVKAGNSSIVAGDYATFEGMRVGLLEGNSKNENFARYASSHGFGYTPVCFDTQEALTGALQAEEVDAIVTGSLREPENEWLIDSFDATPFYVCVRRDAPELMAIIDEAIDAMDMHEPDWRNVLHDRYYASDRSGLIVFTPEERAFLQQLREAERPLDVLVNPVRAPYSGFRDGEAVGIFPTIFAELAQQLGISWRYLPVRDREEYYALRASGAADIVLDFPSDSYMAEERGYKISEPYFRTTFTRLSRNGFNGTVQKVATVADSDMLEGFVSLVYSPEQIVYYDSEDACVDAVADGEVDVTVLHSYMAERYVREDSRNRFSATLMGESSLSYSLAVRSSDGYLLLSLLNKVVDRLSENRLNALVAQAVEEGNGGRSISLTAFLYSNPVYALLGMALLLLLLFALVMLALRSRNQHRLQESVSRATAALEARTQELSEALQAADAANRAKTTFLNNMSHDIRTPMNAIIGFTALATSHLDERERALDYLQKINQASNHLLSLINDVLDMSRIESGKVTIEEKPENLAEILRSLRNIIQPDIHAKKLQLFIDTLDVRDEEVCCDKLRLNQILLNLTSNAIKFTPSGGSVTLQLREEPCKDAEHALYEFRVRDTGIGMSPDFLQSVFEPFTREHSSTVSGIQGTGLGMAITRNIVEMMHGSIDVESEPGVGSEFTVRLKFRLVAAPGEMQPMEELQGKRALVVDDDLLSCRGVSHMLRQLGMHAEWTRSGHEAIVRAQEAIELGEAFDLYIIDWSMPELSGVGTVRKLRGIAGGEPTILLMTAYDWADIEKEARDAGVTDFVSKPLFASDLRRTLGRCPGKAEGEAQAAPQQGEGEFAHRRILLAEDNELNREIATELLTEEGLEVECAEDGERACEMVEAADPAYYELILMDIQMPVLDGYAATQRIRAMEDRRRADIPIIAMTANAFEEDRERAIGAGMNGHLAKPIDMDKLLAILRKFLR